MRKSCFSYFFLDFCLVKKNFYQFLLNFNVNFLLNELLNSILVFYFLADEVEKNQLTRIHFIVNVSKHQKINYYSKVDNFV